MKFTDKNIFIRTVTFYFTGVEYGNGFIRQAEAETLTGVKSGGADGIIVGVGVNKMMQCINHLEERSWSWFKSGMKVRSVSGSRSGLGSISWSMYSPWSTSSPGLRSK